MNPERWKEIEKLYHSTLEVEPDRRNEFLAKECGGDDSLRKEVERLLDTQIQMQAETFIEAPAIEMLAQGLAADSDRSTSTPSMVGLSLGHYQVIDRLGKGGMGEVYRATDQTLGRDVAIKILPEEFARDADCVARLKREAKLLASLNHPNIATIYGLEETGGTNFLVLELVEGDTLADRIKAGPVPSEEALKLALQIAEALEAAHEKGIMHRDLKPANIKVTPDGKVKVLDFGLAKAFAGDKGELNLSNSLTLSNEATQLGVIQGTAAYMSPEQARGKAVTRKADIWAFGCVLFEMLTGRVAFSGADITDILAAVIRSEPDWSALPSQLHWRLRELVKRCLDKELRNRYHDISDVRVDLQKILSDPTVILPVSMNPLPKYKKIPWIAAAVILIALLAISVIWISRTNPPKEPNQVISLPYTLPDDQEFDHNLTQPILAISADGTKIAVCTPNGIFLRSMDGKLEGIIRGTEHEKPQSPFFLTEDKWIGFYASDRKIKKIPIGGDIPPKDLSTGREQVLGYLTWNAADRTIIYMGREGVKKLRENGGEPEVIIRRDRERDAPGFSPRMLPGNEVVLFAISVGNDYKIAVQRRSDPNPKIIGVGSDAQYVKNGYLVYIKDKNIVAAPFDLNDPEKELIPESLGIEVLRTTGAPQFAFSASSGTLAYLLPNADLPIHTLVWVDRYGREESLGTPPNDAYSNPSISPDGRKVAFSAGALSASDIKIWNIENKYTSFPHLTSGGNINTDPVWRPNGRQIVFYSQQKANYGVFEVEIRNSEKTSLFPRSVLTILPECFDKNNALLATASQVGSYRFEIGILDKGAWKQLMHQDSVDFLQPRISPDGQWIAYTSNANEKGKYEVWLCSYPELGEPYLVSNGGGDSPLWSPDGRELFYRHEDEVMAVSIDGGTSMSRLKPRLLFQGTYVQSDFTAGSYEQFHTWDIKPDGSKFLMMKEVGDNASVRSGPRQIKIILNWNWLEELQGELTK
jgi:eukaryotic-like serine/threonine-protein kinase